MDKQVAIYLVALLVGWLGVSLLASIVLCRVLGWLNHNDEERESEY